ncbi:hypothetical protein ENBRE01_0441 [Enteropsectra breve]|nr:hypothetical protein ENBRE01_0441 [Enteropsectra breve]
MPTSEFYGIYFNMLKACVGSGILEFPFLLNKYGVLLTSCYTFLSAAAATAGIYIYIDLNDKYGKNNSMASLSRHIVRGMETFVSFVLSTKCYVTAIMYIVLINSNLKILLNEDIGDGERNRSRLFYRIVANIVAFLATQFFITKTNINSLKRISFIGIVMVLVLFIGAAFCSDKRDGEVKMLAGRYNLIDNIGTFIFGFNCHHTIFSVQNASAVSKTKLKKYMAAVFSSAFVIYICFALLNCVFLKSPLQNIFESWKDSSVKHATLLIYSMGLVVNTILQLHPVVDHLSDLLPAYKYSRQGVGAILLVSAFTIVWLWKLPFEKISLWIGLIFSNLICFGFPFLYRMADKSSISFTQKAAASLLPIFSILCCLRIVSVLGSWSKK